MVGLRQWNERSRSGLDGVLEEWLRCRRNFEKELYNMLEGIDATVFGRNPSPAESETHSN